MRCEPVPVIPRDLEIGDLSRIAYARLASQRPSSRPHNIPREDLRIGLRKADTSMKMRALFPPSWMRSIGSSLEAGDFHDSVRLRAAQSSPERNTLLWFTRSLPSLSERSSVGLDRMCESRRVPRVYSQRFNTNSPDDPNFDIVSLYN